MFRVVEGFWGFRGFGLPWSLVKGFKGLGSWAGLNPEGLSGTVHEDR